MQRRSFLASLFAAPVAVKAAPVVAKFGQCDCALRCSGPCIGWVNPAQRGVISYDAGGESYTAMFTGRLCKDGSVEIETFEGFSIAYKTKHLTDVSEMVKAKRQ